VAEIEGFAEALSKDHEAVKAALTHKWSSGQTEGQINRLKFIKRQMYGRANFELLKARFLYAA
jgi:transposase